MSSTTLGQYELLHRLAHGGMAEIFLAKRRGPGGFDKRVVIKRVLPHLSENRDFVQMFLDEARLASRLNHPNIVQIFDFGEIEQSYYLCMEHLEGEDLATVLSILRDRGEILSPQVAAIVLSAACDGMHYAHTMVDEAGRPLKIVHRDLSPSNLFLTTQGAVKVLDFGVATMEGKLVETQSGVVKGKFAYLSPEQALGHALDARSDVFALGLILHEALTGKKVFKRASEAATLRAVLEEPIEPPRKLRSDLPDELGRIVMKALARSPEDRWQSAQQMRAALDEFLASRGSVPATAQLQAFMQSIVGKARDLETAPTPQADLGAVLPPSTRADARLDAVTRATPLPGQAATAVERTPARTTAPARKEARPDPEAETTDYAPADRRGLSALPLFLAVVLGATLIAGGWWLSEGQTTTPGGGEDEAALAATGEPEGEGEGEGEAGDPAPAGVEESPTPSAGEEAALAVARRTAVGVNAGQAIGSKSRTHRRRRGGGRAKKRGSTRGEIVAVSPPAAKSPAVGKLDVNCKPFCQIWIDDEDTGETSPALGLTLPEGEHHLKLINPPTRMIREKKVTIEAGKTRRITIAF